MTIPDSAYDLHSAFIKGDLSAEAIVRHFLNRIDQLDGKVGAFLAVFREEALEQAKKLDLKRQEGKPLGKLAGIPIALKDNIHIRGKKTTCGSRFLEEYKAIFDSTVARRMMEEDAILIGKTNMDEFAMGSSTEHSAFHKTHNPWDLSCVPGGSSGGSAAAVAAGFVPLALGSDTGGSIRQPAACCNVVGVKPTYGRVSRYGLVAFGSSLDQIGPLARSTRDAALLMEVIGSPCEKDATSLSRPAEEYISHLRTDLNGVRIGVPMDSLESLPGNARANFDQAVNKLKELGATVHPITLSTLEYSVSMYYILATAEASTNLARFDGIGFSRRSTNANTLEEVYDLSREEGFGPEVKRRILLGTYVLSEGYQEAFYQQAQKIRTKMIREFEDVFSQNDLIFLPTAPGTAFKFGSFPEPIQMYLQDIFTLAANLTGTPAVSVPSGFDPGNGLPYGVQFMGPQQSDVKVFGAAHAYEQATRFGERRPNNLEVS